MSAQDVFCLGSSTMNHAGFGPLNNDYTPCVVYLSSSTVLATPVKYAFATLGTVAMGILVEYLTRVRVVYVPKLSSKKKRFLGEAGVFFVQTWIAFFVMLIAMTYSLPLFVAVVVGLAVGHYWFNPKVVGYRTCGCETRYDESASFSSSSVVERESDELNET